VRRALDMTSGLPDMIDSAWILGIPRTALLDRERVLAFLAAIQDLNFNPGDEFCYSNAGYRLVEAAIEAQGIALEAGIRDHLFEPLGVHAATPRDQADVVPRLASRGTGGGQSVGVTASRGCRIAVQTDWQQALNSLSSGCKHFLPVAARLAV
jgi:CubicO group peptidase (beta-lactamase class C family)